nr:CDP-alcohol phosphatidyltransferase family protein [Planctomycetota bacterium]
AGACWLGSRRCPDQAGDIALLIGAAVCIQLRLLCNLLDGMVAVEGGLRSPTGELWNDVPDRFADVLILVPVGYATGVAWGPELGWVAGMAALLTAYQRWLGAGVGRGQDFGGPLAKPQRMAVLTVAGLVGAAARPWQHDGQVLFAALGLIVLGALLTVALRLRRLARRMGTPP